MQLVPATCSAHYSGTTTLFEPLDQGLPAGLLTSPALVHIEGGTVYTPVVNVGTSDVLLNPLSHLSSAKLGALEQRWAARLASFDFESRYSPGKSNTTADALSRLHPPGAIDLETIVAGTPLQGL